MASLRIVGIALLVLGLLSLAYQGITYTKSEKVLEVGPITATKETKKTIPLPPILGVSLWWAVSSFSSQEPVASGGLSGSK